MANERNWRQAMKAAIRDPDELCRLVGLDDRWREPARRAASQFPVFAPLEFLARVAPGDPFDPLLRQVLPLDAETLETSGFSRDPVGDGLARREAGLLQKYAGRALLITTGACAIHCRYCFRRHYPYEETPRSLEAWAPALERLAADPSIEEVLLSGGDPLTLVDEQLAALAGELAAIPHLRRLRLHTRLPIVIPQRVDDALIGWLRSTRLAPIMVIHANHPAEIDSAVADSLGKLVDAGIPVLNQAVLLRGVNDNVETLAELSRRLVNLRVLPYYLHQLDRVVGAAHFEVPASLGQTLVKELETRLPGYAVPKYVQEIPGAASKTRIL